MFSLQYNANLLPSTSRGRRVWFVPQDQTVGLNTGFTTEIHVNSGSQRLATYDFDVSFSSNIISVNISVGSSGVEAGPDGYVAAVNANTPGALTLSGFNAEGKGPGTDLNVVTISWQAVGEGTSSLNLTVNNLGDENTNSIGTPSGKSGSVTV